MKKTRDVIAGILITGTSLEDIARNCRLLADTLSRQHRDVVTVGDREVTIDDNQIYAVVRNTSSFKEKTTVDVKPDYVGDESPIWGDDPWEFMNDLRDDQWHNVDNRKGRK